VRLHMAELLTLVGDVLGASDISDVLTISPGIVALFFFSVEDISVALLARTRVNLIRGFISSFPLSA
jgi:hypothetical protein